MGNYNPGRHRIKSILLKDFSFTKDTLPLEVVVKDSLTNPYIFYLGNLNLLENRQEISAVVGPRDPISETRELTKELVEYLVTKEHRTIISGFAKGVDSIALETALKFEGNRIGVLSTSINDFLRKNPDLEIDESILLISLMDPESKPSGFEFKTNPLRRNKYIYSLSSEAFITECNKVRKGGTWRGSTEYLKKIYPKTSEKSIVYISKNEKFPAHFELEKRGAKYFQIKNGELNRFDSFKLF